MSWKISTKEFEAVIKLPAPKRYEYFVKKVTDFEEIWCLKGEDGYIMALDPEEHEVMLVWPHSKYVEAYIEKDDHNVVASVITLNHLMKVLLPQLEKEGKLIAVFPSPQKNGSVVIPERLLNDLEEELENY